MKRIVRLLPALLLVAGAAHAMSKGEALDLAGQLGLVIGSETACGLSYDQAAIAAFITANVPPDQLDFAGYLQIEIDMETDDFQDMTTSAKTAHCAAVTRSARHLGFID